MKTTAKGEIYFTIKKTIIRRPRKKIEEPN